MKAVRQIFYNLKWVGALGLNRWSPPLYPEEVMCVVFTKVMEVVRANSPLAAELLECHLGYDVPLESLLDRFDTTPEIIRAFVCSAQARAAMYIDEQLGLRSLPHPVGGGPEATWDLFRAWLRWSEPKHVPPREIDPYLWHAGRACFPTAGSLHCPAAWDTGVQWQYTYYIPASSRRPNW